MNLPLPARVLSKLIQVIGYVSSSRDDILNAAAGQIMDLFDIDACSFAVAEKNCVHVAAVKSKDAEFVQSVLGKNLEAQCPVLRDGLLMCVEDSAKSDGCPSGLICGWATSYLCVPLTIRGERLGVMSLASKTSHVFAAEEIDLYLAVASLVAIALQNADFYSATEHQANEMREQVREKTHLLRVINRITERLNAATSRRQVLEFLSAEIGGLIACDRITLAVVDDKADVAVSILCGDPADWLPAQAVPLSKTVLENLGKTGKARIQNGSPPAKAAHLVGPDVLSYAIVPMMTGNQAIGALSFARTSNSIFKHSDLPNLTQVAGQVAEAFRRIELFEREKNAVAELETLYDASQALTSTIQLRDTLRVISKQLAVATGSDVCLLLKIEGSTSSLVASYAGAIDTVHRPLRVSLPPDVVASTLTAQVYTNRGRPNCPEGASGWLEALAAHLGPHIMLVPISDREKTVAMAIIARSGAPYGDVELRIASAIAAQSAIAMQASHVYEHERTIAEAFQKSLLPDADYSRPGLSIASIYQAALDEAEVGGDFWGIISIDDRYVGIAVGDISGKGLAAATQAAATRHMLKAYALEDPTPCVALSRLNNALCKSLSESFVTLFYGVIDTVEGAVTYANAGHELPVTMRDGIVSNPLDVTGPALAICDDATYSNRVVELGRRDLILCYTDGITEARCGGRLWGYEGLTDALRKRSSLNPRTVVDHIYASALGYSHGHLTDDVILMAICRG